MRYVKKRQEDIKKERKKKGKVWMKEKRNHGYVAASGKKELL